LLRRTLSIFKSEFIRNWRDRFNFFLGLVFIVMIMFMMGFIFGGDEMSITIKIDAVDLDDSEISRQLLDGFNESGIVELNLTTEELAHARVLAGDVNAYLLIPEGFGEALSGGGFGGAGNATLYAVIDDTNSGSADLTRSVLQGFVANINQQSSEQMYAMMEGIITGNQSILAMLPQQNPPDSGVSDDVWALLMSGNLDQLWEPYGVSTDDVLAGMDYMAKPLDVEVNSFTTGDRFNYISWLFPGLLLLLVLWNGLMFTTLTVVENKENGMLRRIFSTPTGSGSVLAGITIAVVLKLFIDFLILTAIAFTFFTIVLPGDWLLAFPLLVLCILSMIGLGLILGAFIKDSKAAEGACIGLAMSLQFLTGLFIPLWQLPTFLQDIMSLVPLTQGQEALRQVLYYGGDWESIAPTVGILTLQTAVLFGIGVFLYTWMVRRHMV